MRTNETSPGALNTAAAPPACVLIFGASGDLTQRKLAPALHSLACAGHLSPRTRVVGLGRTPLSNDAFRARLFAGVEEYARLKPDPKLCDLWSHFESRFKYIRTSPNDSDDCVRLAEYILRAPDALDTEGNLLFYLATPPSAVPAIVRCLGEAGLANPRRGWRRIVFEKPFGENLDSARALNRLIHTAFDEPHVFRIDHYLGKETVQNILAFRFANIIFEPLWNADLVDHVQITAAESIGVGQRSAYYERAGVLRDIVQNHLLQLLALVAMERPADLTPQALRDEKVKVLSAVCPPDNRAVVLGQYEGYREEDGVAQDSTTPTYAALRLFIDNGRWRDVPFYLRSGKRLAKKTTEISIQFRRIPHRLLRGRAPAPNRLSVRIEPDEGVHLQFETKIPGAGMRTQPEDMAFNYQDRFGRAALPDAYERLLLDALHGDPSLFLRDDEIELCWAILDPILRCNLPVSVYPPGSWGPPAADGLFAGAGRCWLSECREAKG